MIGRTPFWAALSEINTFALPKHATSGIAAGKAHGVEVLTNKIRAYYTVERLVLAKTVNPMSSDFPILLALIAIFDGVVSLLFER